MLLWAALDTPDSARYDRIMDALIIGAYVGWQILTYGAAVLGLLTFVWFCLCLIGAIGDGDTPTATQLSEGGLLLNMLIKHWKTYHLRYELALLLSLHLAVSRCNGRMMAELRSEIGQM